MLQVPLTEPEYNLFITKLKRTCFGAVPRSKYIRLKQVGLLLYPKAIFTSARRHSRDWVHAQELVKIREDIARCEAETKKARQAAAKSLAAQKRTEKQLQAYVEYVRQLRAVPAPP